MALGIVLVVRKKRSNLTMSQSMWKIVTDVLTHFLTFCSPKFMVSLKIKSFISIE